MSALRNNTQDPHEGMDDMGDFSQAALPPTQRIPRNLVNSHLCTEAELDACIGQLRFFTQPEPIPAGVPESESEAMMMAFISAHADADADFSGWGDLYDPARDTFRCHTPPLLPAEASSHLLQTDEPAPPLPVVHTLAPLFNRWPRRTGLAVVALLLALLGFVGQLDYEDQLAVADATEPQP